LKQNVVNYLVKRFLRFDKEQPFIFLSALLAYLGILLGVMVLIIAMALMNGFDNEFKKKLTIMNYPLTIMPKFYGAVNKELLEKLRYEFPTLSFSPYVVSSVITRKNDLLEGGYIFGVDFEQEVKVNSVIAKALQQNKKIGKFEVVIGKSLKEEFDIHPNDKVMYIFTQVNPTGFSVTPLIKRFRVKAVFNSGLLAYDKAYSYTTIESMQRILSMPRDQFSGIHISSPNPQQDIKKIAMTLPESVAIKGWWQDNLNFFAALKMEKTSLFIVLMLIILIASINIISSLLMTVMNRRSEIALLLSLGATKKEIKAVFLKLGIVIGVAGIVSGAILGLFGIWVLGTFDIVHLPKDVYPTTTLPLDLSVLDFFLIIAGAFVIVILSSFYPAKKASEVDVLTVLRNE